MILKKANIEIEALEKTALVALIKNIDFDKTVVKVDLYEYVKHTDTVIQDMDGNIIETIQGDLSPHDRLAKNRTYSWNEAKELFGVTFRDHRAFHPEYIKPTEEEIKAQKIAELEKTIAEATEKLEILKG